MLYDIRFLNCHVCGLAKRDYWPLWKETQGIAGFWEMIQAHAVSSLANENERIFVSGQRPNRKGSLANKRQVSPPPPPTLPSGIHLAATSSPQARQLAPSLDYISRFHPDRAWSRGRTARCICMVRSRPHHTYTPGLYGFS